MNNINAVFIDAPLTARELLAKLRHLTLVGQTEGGDLEWMGTEEQWDRYVAEAIDHD
jgi:hypothetical protein